MKILLFLLLPFSLTAQKKASIKYGANDAINLTNSFSTEQKAKAVFLLSDTSRYSWHYVPATSIPRNGISIKDLDSTQKKYFYALLKSSLSGSGYKKTTDIMNMEYYLKELQPTNAGRIPENYFFSIYGNPAKDTCWAWKFTGHHVSLNFTIVNGELAYAPFFFGVYPAEIKEGTKKGFRIIKEEEDLGFRLINSLDQQQQQIAIFELKAFYDIVTSNTAKVSELKPVGIFARELTLTQKDILNKLIASYLLSMPYDIAQKRIERILKEDFNDLRFGWAGDTVAGKPHYYRIQGKSFLIEFDNTQQDANHIHEVWRDFDGDYGIDLLREHYNKSSHHHKH